MSTNIKLDANGLCTTCMKISGPNELVECFTCSGNFHVSCSAVPKDEKTANKTLVTHFLNPSTKRNFLFLCDACLTDFEVSNAETDSQRINTLETKIASFGNQLCEIKNLITSQVNTPQANMTHHIEDNSVWFNKEKLAAVKAPHSPSVLVVKKGGNLMNTRSTSIQ